MTKFCGTTPCDECPWRKDVVPGRFPPERFAALASTSKPGDAFKPIFGCHKPMEGQETACVGYLLVEGHANLAVRVAEFSGKIPELESTYPLYGCYADMAAVNGVPVCDWDAGVRHPMQTALEAAQQDFFPDSTLDSDIVSRGVDLWMNPKGREGQT